MAGLNKWTDEQYYQEFEGGNAPDDFDGLGGYQYITLPEIVNNFMITYVGGKKVLSELGQHEAQFHAQRAIAELSYDVARPIQSLEYELVGSLVMPLPKNFVNLVGVYVIDNEGIKRPLRIRTESGNPTSPLQNEDGLYLYDDNGDIIENSTSSTTEDRYVNNTSDAEYQKLNNYYGLAGLDSTYGGNRFGQGRRYGINPQYANNYGTYLLNEDKGLITFDNKATDKVILLDYITDGLDEDLDKIKIHKYLEEAVYMYMMSKITKGRADVNGNDKQMYQQDYAMAKRRGKMRLQQLDAKELIYVLRNRNQWIKI